MPFPEAAVIGDYVIHDGRLIKSKSSKLVPEKKKNEYLKILATKTVPKEIKQVEYKEGKDELVQTIDTDKSKKQLSHSISTISRVLPSPSAAMKQAILELARNDSKHLHLTNSVTQSAADSIGTCVRLILRTMIEHAKKIASHGNRKRLTVEDIDLAYGAINSDYNVIFPFLKPIPHTDRLFWGRRVVKSPHSVIAANSNVMWNEKITNSIVIRDHWLVIEGIKPCIPDNDIPTEVKRKIQQQQEEAQRTVGVGLNGIKKEYNFEKRMSKQVFSLEHQVLFNEVVNIITNGTALERQKVLECIETDSGLQFLAGRFVILIAEGVRVNIGTRNVRALSNLMKLTWCLMKNPKIRLEKYLYVLVPSIISCIVAKTLVPLVDPKTQTTSLPKNRAATTVDTLSSDEEERIIRDLDFEFRLRESSSRILASLSEQYPSQCLNVRIIHILRKVLSGTHDPSTLYGALSTFFAFGYLTVKNIVIPRLHDIYCTLSSYCSEESYALRAGSAKVRKVVAEADMKRIELARNRVVELIMKMIYEYEACEHDRRIVERDVFVKSYAEFGYLFYSHLIETGKIDEEGRVLVNRPSLLSSKSMLNNNDDHSSNQGETKYAVSAVKRNKVDIDEEMLENILDDSLRPWAEVAKKVQEKESNEDNAVKASNRNVFFGSPKLLLIKRTKPETSTDGVAQPRISYIRPLELAHLPGWPSSRSARARNEKAAPILSRSGTSVRMSRSVISVDDPITSNSISRDPTELVRKYLQRSEKLAAAAVYGRALDMSGKGRQQLESRISEVASKLNNIRLRNAVSNSRPSSIKEDMTRGKFLCNIADRNTVL